MGALHPGQMLEGTSYQVVREIGAGGMGVVYEIEHVRLRKRYVAKVLHEQIKNEHGALKRMEREAQVLAAISHPGIVQVHDFGTTTDGVTYFVMEKLEGVDLRRTMKAGTLSRTRAIGIIAEVLEALEYVHRRGIVHRDIKPENIFLAESPQGTVTKVLDFGIVHVLDKDGSISQGRITKTGGFVGTLNYAAPEQMEGRATGPANDVYAAGLVLFELIAGKGPFDDDPGVGLSRCFKPAPRLGELTSAPEELSELLSRALERDPERRPTAGALASELRSLVGRVDLNPVPDDDDPVRAEVDDLLRHMPTFDSESPRIAAAASAGSAARAGRASVPHASTLPSASGASSEGGAARVEARRAEKAPLGKTAPGLGGPAAAETPTTGPLRRPSPSAPSVRGEGTSPGVYATLDHPPPSLPGVQKARRVAIAIVAGAAVVATLILVVGLTHRSRQTPTSSAGAPALDEPAAAAPPGVPPRVGAAPPSPPASSPGSATPKPSESSMAPAAGEGTSRSSL